jgi:hypothetical protein
MHQDHFVVNPLLIPTTLVVCISIAYAVVGSMIWLRAEEQSDDAHRVFPQWWRELIRCYGVPLALVTAVFASRWGSPDQGFECAGFIAGLYLPLLVARILTRVVTRAGSQKWWKTFFKTTVPAYAILSSALIWATVSGSPSGPELSAYIWSVVAAVMGFPLVVLLRSIEPAR